MITALRELLLPQTTVLTPNSLEARRLTEVGGNENPALDECARRLIASGCRYVPTGTHENRRASAQYPV